MNANIILDSFNKMGCDIFSPGSKDFALGKNFLVDFSKKSKFPFISSNIYDDNDKSYVFTKGNPSHDLKFFIENYTWVASFKGINFDSGSIIARYNGSESSSYGKIAVSYTHLTLPTNREV